MKSFLVSLQNADPGMFSAECDVLRKTGFQNQFNQLLDGVVSTS